MEKNPKVSILMATWCRPKIIGEAIQSVLDQSFQDWELIVADDGSPDETPRVMAAWQARDNRIKYLRLAHQGRIAVVSNAGLKEARGEYVAILDDDDVWSDPHKLSKQVRFLDAHADHIACGGGMIAIDEAGRELGRFLKPEDDTAIRRVALAANPLINSTTIFRRLVIGHSALYDESLPQFADWGFWLELGRHGKLHNFQEYFVRYRMWDKSSSFTKQKENARAALVIVRRYKNYYPGFWKAWALASAYRIYVNFPAFVRRTLNPVLSSAKKKAFSA